MKRLLAALALSALAAACTSPQAATGPAWRASDVNGDSAGVGYELRSSGGAVSGDFYAMSPDYPHDFAHASMSRMEFVSRGAGTVTFRVKLRGESPSVVRFTLPPGPWPAAFRSVVTEVFGDGDGEPEAFEFSEAR